MISWVFFDVGNVILNDDPAQARAFILLYRALAGRGQAMSFDELLAERRKLVRQEGMEPTRPYFQTLGKRLLGDDYPGVLASMAEDIFPRWGELNPVIPGVPNVIGELKEKYQLGLLANQPREVIDVLKGHGLWDVFTVQGISAEVGLHKPAPAFFQWALDQAGCLPEQALMIGDRVDNDILPARSVGMKTLRLILHPESKGYRPEDPCECAYMSERVSFFNELRRKGTQTVAADIEEEAVERIPIALAELATE